MTKELLLLLFAPRKQQFISRTSTRQMSKALWIENNLITLVETRIPKTKNLISHKNWNKLISTAK